MKPILLALVVLVVAGGAAAQTTTPKKNNRLMKSGAIKRPRPFLRDPEKLNLILSPAFKKPAGMAFSKKTTIDTKTNLSLSHMETNEIGVQFDSPQSVNYIDASFGPGPNGITEIDFQYIQRGAQPEIYLFELNIMMFANRGMQPVAPVFTIYNTGSSETQTITPTSLTNDASFKLIFTTFVKDQSAIQISCSNLNNWPGWMFRSAQLTRVNP